MESSIRGSSAEELVYAAPAQTTTPTSPNTNVVASPSGDVNNTTQLTFQYQGRIPVWTPTVSQAQTQVELGSDIAIGTTVWKKGITVQYIALSGSQYSVSILSGQIIDGYGSYSLTGVTLGVFPIAKPKPLTNTEPELAKTESDNAFPVMVFTALTTVNTPTSPNSNVKTTPSSDTNNTTYLSFEYQGRIPVWTPIVSQSQPSATLGADITVGGTTWKSGIQVVYTALGSTQYTVSIIQGQIIDDRGLYELKGTTLGIFPIG